MERTRRDGPTFPQAGHEEKFSEFFVIVMLTFVVLVLSGELALAAPIDSADIHVIDGDTIRVHHKQPDVRLVGFNAPETRRAACDAEGELGAKATRRLRELVRTNNLDFEFVPCACQPGTEGTQACNYGRRCGTLKVRSRDAGAILIEEGLAVPFLCGGTRCPPTPRPWC
jgi:endonuclease YncB( thermonuclease family)